VFIDWLENIASEIVQFSLGQQIGNKTDTNSNTVPRPCSEQRCSPDLL
jgi:hypothetical protein